MSLEIDDEVWTEKNNDLKIEKDNDKRTAKDDDVGTEKGYSKNTEKDHDSCIEKGNRYDWCVLAMSFLSYSLNLGFSVALLGNMTVQHKDKYGITTQESSTISSVHLGMFFLFSPLVSILVKKLNSGIVEILGGICLVTGLGLSSLASQPWHSYILFSVLAAFGLSCSYLASSQVLAQNFHKYKYLAFSVATLGLYSGIVAWPPLSQYLFDTFGYSKTMGIMSSFHAVHLVTGVVFLPKTKSRIAPLAYSEGSSDNKNGGENGVNEIPVSRDSVHSKPLHEQAKEIFTSVKVWVLFAGCGFFTLNISSFFILTTDYIQNYLHISREEAALGTSFLGGGNVAGCLFVIAVSRIKFDRLFIHITSIALYGATTVIIAYSVNKATFYGLMVLWGIGRSAHISNQLAVISDICVAGDVALLYGIHLFVEGAGAMGGPPLFAYIAERYGNLLGLIGSGCTGLLASCILSTLLIQKHCLEKTNTNQDISVDKQAGELTDTEAQILPHVEDNI